MITKVKIPKLTENDEEQVVTAWLRKVGDTVKRGDPLVELSTSKAAFELEAPRAGIVRAILADVKSSLPVGYVVALIGEARDPLPDVAAANRKLMEAAGRKVRVAPAAPAPAGSGEAGTFRATPAARRLGREHGIDLAAVQANYKVDVVTESVLLKYIAEK